MRKKPRRFGATVRIDRPDKLRILAGQIRNKRVSIRSTFDQDGDRPIYFPKIAQFITQASKIRLPSKLIEQKETIARQAPMKGCYQQTRCAKVRLG